MFAVSIPCIVEGFRSGHVLGVGVAPERRAFMMPSISLAQVTYSLFLALVLLVPP
ncbi:unnamed protein product [Ectocarpus sp. 12 AP-2014]